MSALEISTPPKQGVIIVLDDDDAPDEFVVDLQGMFEVMGLEVLVENETTFLARGRVVDCDCQLLQCVCAEARRHAKECRYRFAMTCAVPIACDPHGRDVCPTCDACTCSLGAP